MGRVTFEVRDRARMAGFSIADLSKGDRRDVLHAQATIMANVHREAWGDASDQEIHDWLDKSSKVLSKRWEAAFKSAH
jgi:hypothetical protein